MPATRDSRAKSPQALQPGSEGEDNLGAPARSGGPVGRTLGALPCRPVGVSQPLRAWGAEGTQSVPLPCCSTSECPSPPRPRPGTGRCPSPAYSLHSSPLPQQESPRPAALRSPCPGSPPCPATCPCFAPSPASEPAFCGPDPWPHLHGGSASGLSLLVTRRYFLVGLTLRGELWSLVRPVCFLRALPGPPGPRTQAAGVGPEPRLRGEGGSERVTAWALPWGTGGLSGTGGPGWAGLGSGWGTAARPRRPGPLVPAVAVWRDVQSGLYSGFMPAVSLPLAAAGPGTSTTHNGAELP